MSAPYLARFSYGDNVECISERERGKFAGDSLPGMLEEVLFGVELPVGGELGDRVDWHLQIIHQFTTEDLCFAVILRNCQTREEAEAIIQCPENVYWRR